MVSWLSVGGMWVWAMGGGGGCIALHWLNSDVLLFFGRGFT